MNDALKKSVSRHGRKQQVDAPQYTPLADAVDRFQGTWGEHIPTAKTTWSLLSERELKRSEGNAESLKWLIQQRYTMSPRDAHDQVEQFIRTCGY